MKHKKSLQARNWQTKKKKSEPRETERGKKLSFARQMVISSVWII